MRIKSFNHIVSVVVVLRNHLKYGIKEARDAAVQSSNLPMNTNLYVDLLIAGAEVTLEPGEVLRTYEIEVIIHNVPKQIKLWNDRLAMALELLSNPISKDGVILFHK